MKPSTKLQQFTKELNQLLKRYQYRLEAGLQYTRQGITAGLNIVDTPPPPKKEKNAKPNNP